jgi:hypothetical protein
VSPWFHELGRGNRETASELHKVVLKVLREQISVTTSSFRAVRCTVPILFGCAACEEDTRNTNLCKVRWQEKTSKALELRWWN